MHAHTSIPPFCLIQACTLGDPWGNSGAEHFFGVTMCCEGRNAVIHRTAILCLNSQEDCTVNAKQGRANTWIALNAGSFFCVHGKNSRLCWRSFLIIYSCVSLAANNNLLKHLPASQRKTARATFLLCGYLLHLLEHLEERSEMTSISCHVSCSLGGSTWC